MAQPELTSPPEKTLADSAHAVAKGAVVAGAAVIAALAPALAAPAALLPEIFQLVVAPPLERRRDAFLRELQERLLEVEGGNVSAENLAANPLFISTVIQATQAAVRTHRRIHLDALRNCVINTALAKGADERKVEYFVAAVGDLSEMHIEALKIARTTSHAGSSAIHTKVELSQMPSVVERVCRALDLSVNEHSMARKAWGDLQTLGFVVDQWSGGNPVIDLKLAAQYGETLTPILQPLGVEFLNFISDPTAEQPLE